MKGALGIDLGGTKARAALVMRDGRVVRAGTRRINRGISPEECVELVASAALEAAGVKDGIRKKVSSVGLAAAGQIHARTREIIYSPNHGWHDVPFARMLAHRLGVPVAIENDVNAAALGEHRFGAGKGAQSLVAVFVGTGIGGAFILDGRLYTGASGVAAEIGHMLCRENGPRCSCGRCGCYEAYAGGACIERRFGSALKRVGASVARKMGFSEPDSVRATDICRAARRGVPLAARYWSEAESALSALAVNLVTALNPEVLVIGGTIGLNAPGLVRQLAAAVRSRSTKGSAGAVRVLRAKTGQNAGVLGASLLKPLSTAPRK
jgi:glucokinase